MLHSLRQISSFAGPLPLSLLLLLSLAACSPSQGNPSASSAASADKLSAQPQGSPSPSATSALELTSRLASANAKITLRPERKETLQVFETADDEVPYLMFVLPNDEMAQKILKMQENDVWLYYLHLLDKDPEDLHLTLSLASANLLFENPGYARNLTQRILKVVPNFAPALLLEGEVLLKQGTPSIATDHLSKAIAADPEYAPFYLERGIAWMKDNRYTEAKTDFLAYQQKRPNDPYGYYFLGKLYLSSSSTPEAAKSALPSLNQALELAPQNWRFHMIHGLCQAKMKLPEAAKQDFERAIELGSGIYQAAFDIAQSLTQAGFYPEGQKQFEAAIALKPERLKNYSALAENLRLQKQYRQAIGGINQALEKLKTDKALLKARAQIYYEMNEYQKAITDLDAVIEPEFPQNWRTEIIARAKAKSGLGDYQGALADFKLAYIDSDADAINELGMVYFRMKDYASALREFNRALTKTAYPHVLQTINNNKASALASMGQYEEAIKIYLEIEAQSPDFPGLQGNLGLAYTLLGKCDEAGTHYAKAGMTARSCPV
ncbi:MAG: tetratricopeptide repeat protein [Candidatus Sericytochromatia bacterium]